MVKDLLLVVLCILGGTGGGYYGASFATVPNQIAIVDVAALVKRSASTGNQSEADAHALTARIKRTTTKLVEQGIVVIDAPEEAYVPVD